MEDGKSCIRSESGLFGVSFVGRFVRGKKMWEVIVVVGRYLGRMGLCLMLLLWDIWYHLQDNVFNGLEHNCLKRCESLVDCFGDR